jgi:drug/metabolite transporter (DMT)-like permease
VLVLVAVLGAAVLHATWNAMAHGVPDRLAGFALLGLASGVAGLIATVVTGPPPSGTWPYIIASIVLHLVYYGGLLASYQLGQFSQMYPLARGTSPWVVAVVSIASIIFGAIVGAVFFGECFGPRRAIAAAVVVSGIVLISAS